MRKSQILGAFFGTWVLSSSLVASAVVINVTPYSDNNNHNTCLVGKVVGGVVRPYWCELVGSIQAHAFPSGSTNYAFHLNDGDNMLIVNSATTGDCWCKCDESVAGPDVAFPIGYQVQLFAYDGEDRIYGSSFAPLASIMGGDGDDTIRTGTANDIDVHGGNDNDYIYDVAGAGDKLYGDGGADDYLCDGDCAFNACDGGGAGNNSWCDGDFQLGGTCINILNPTCGTVACPSGSNLYGTRAELVIESDTAMASLECLPEDESMVY